MAKFKSTTFGKISGKHGDVVAVSMKDGTDYFRAYIIPPNPNTLKQQTQRAKFGFVMKELTGLRKVFTDTLGGQYGLNKAVSMAMKTCVLGEFPDFKLDYSKLLLSFGHIETLHVIDFYHENNKIIIRWDISTATANPDDSVNLVLFNHTSKQLILHHSLASRKSGTIEVEYPDSWSENQLYCWIYLSSATTKLFSESQYIDL